MIPSLSPQHWSPAQDPCADFMVYLTLNLLHALHHCLHAPIFCWLLRAEYGLKLGLDGVCSMGDLTLSIGSHN